MGKFRNWKPIEDEVKKIEKRKRLQTWDYLTMVINDVIRRHENDVAAKDVDAKILGNQPVPANPVLEDKKPKLTKAQKKAAKRANKEKGNGTGTEESPPQHVPEVPANKGTGKGADGGKGDKGKDKSGKGWYGYGYDGKGYDNKGLLAEG